MNKVNIMLLMCCTLLLPFVSQAEVKQCQPQLTSQLQLVGKSQLKVLFFRVYDAILHTDTGRYPDAETVALNLHYLRDIQAEELIENTAKQWQKLGYSDTALQQQWLKQLKQLWPDVKKGDCLLAFTPDGKIINFYNNTGLLGTINSAQFTKQFLAIWLSEHSSYPKNRNELIGTKP
ncbi:chalcone isomerase family protein [Rheinheimera sp. WS51]|uniref:chalcone isomerase family protein n=1 Tax=Rheinheimera sp. WS51 TaxID=3425886 RepID=UPI003D8E4E39